MSTELKMTIEERYKYLRMMQARYRQANKSERSRLLDEMEMMTADPIKDWHSNHRYIDQYRTPDDDALPDNLIRSIVNDYFRAPGNVAVW